MKDFLSAATFQDLLIVFGVGVLAGFSFVYLDNYLLAKIENAVSIPAGVF